ncbi:hypothetical protein C4Q27_01485 [Pseudomonas sp. SWI36]|nr:hypothetical protein C4Q27_01485 [Pseudomonas sp. SWI36]QDW57179.1 hypothetical protein FFH79_010000 [Pseudomonas sp. KBS0802]UZA73401.1 hypothetical protein EZZ80_07775 [Pseudomonas putida]
MSSLLKAAPEEKRSAFYGVMADSGRENGMTARASCSSTHFQRPQKSPPKRASCGTAINQSSRPMMPNNCSRLTNRL